MAKKLKVIGAPPQGRTPVGTGSSRTRPGGRK